MPNRCCCKLFLSVTIDVNIDSQALEKFDPSTRTSAAANLSRCIVERSIVTGAKNLELTTQEVLSPELPSWIHCGHVDCPKCKIFGYCWQLICHKHSLCRFDMAPYRQNHTSTNKSCKFCAYKKQVSVLLPTNECNPMLISPLRLDDELHLNTLYALMCFLRGHHFTGMPSNKFYLNTSVLLLSVALPPLDLNDVFLECT